MGDLRIAFAAPTLSFVIGASGMDGRSSSSGGRRDELCEAQRRATLRAPFVNSTLFVETRDYARSSGSPNPNQGYHWGWNAESLFLIGNAMGEAALSLAYPPAAAPQVPPSPPLYPPPPSLPPPPSPPLSPPPSPSPPPAPPCTVEMLKQRAAGDKTWPIACSDTTLGTADKELDLSGAHLSYGDFKDATFIGAGAIKLNGAGLANADLSGSKLTADGGFGNALIDLSEANLTNTNLSGSELTTIITGNYGLSTIDFTEAILDQADLSGSVKSIVERP